jgi:thiol-disulfide isomerase/thioredoxin
MINPKKMKAILKRAKILLVFSCLLSHSIYAQEQGIKIGQKCPDVIITNLINNNGASLRLSELKGKLIIIDFWNTWCSSCISSMEKLELIQKELNNQLFVLPVTKQKREVAEKFWNNNNNLKKLSFPSVVEDTVLSKYFPHNVVPYMVWLDEHLIVRAITTSQYANKKNIMAVLDKQDFNFIVPKKQVDFDYSKSLITNSSQLSEVESPLYCSLFMPSNNSWRGGSSIKLIRDSVKGSTRFTAVNQPILGLYHLAFLDHINWNLSKRLKLNVTDSTRFFYNKNKVYNDQWRQLNTYSYEQILPSKITDAEFYNTMTKNLDQYFGLKSRIGKQVTKCYVIVDSPVKMPPYKIQTDKEIGVDSLVSILNHDANWFPVVNESKKWRDKKLSHDLLKDLSPAKIKEELLKHGLDLILTDREVDMLIIEEI